MNSEQSNSSRPSAGPPPGPGGARSEMSYRFYERLQREPSPEEALADGVEMTAGLIRDAGFPEPSLPTWGWILDPIFDLPPGWSTPGADPEAAELAQMRFAETLGPAIISTTATAKSLILPVIGYGEDGTACAGAVIAVPLNRGLDPPRSVVISAANVAGIIGIQMSNASRVRAAQRSHEFAAASADAQRRLVAPTDARAALEVAIECLSSCEVLAAGSALMTEQGEENTVARFGSRFSAPSTDQPELRYAKLADYEKATQIELHVRFDGSEAGLIRLQSRRMLSPLELIILDGLVLVVVGTIARFRSNEMIKSLRRAATRKLVEAQERERSLVAADIHDGVLQQLSATAIRLDLALSRVDRRDFKRANSIVADCATEIRSCAREMRELLMELRPQVLDDNGLNAAISELADHVSGTKVDVTSDIPDDIGKDFAMTIFRIVQEALTNVQKHAQASNAHVRLAMSDGSVQIDVEDDGIGYETAVSGPSAEGSHLGLIGIRERAQMFGGAFAISVGSDGGTLVHVDLPLYESRT